MFKKILVGLVVVLGGFAVIVATRPDTFRVERKARIEAPASVLFGVAQDFHRWGEWSPWEKLDPAMKKSYSGASGVGASYEWEGNDAVGQGRMTITELIAPERIGIKLEFKKPFAATNQTTFTFKPADSGTQASWLIEGHANFMVKAMSLFQSMDEMVGKDFEEGLANLKRVGEAETQKLKAEKEAATKQAAAAAPPTAAALPAAAPASKTTARPH